MGGHKTFPYKPSGAVTVEFPEPHCMEMLPKFIRNVVKPVAMSAVHMMG